jgi:ankyrin repeat protein
MSNAAALLDAARENNLDLVRRLVERQHANVDAACNSHGWTALIVASRRGHLRVVKYLVETGGANVEAVEQGGWTALMYASFCGRLAVCQYLIETGRANVDNANCHDGRTALFLACRWAELRIVQYLVMKARANVNVADIYGSTPLIVASQRCDLAMAKCLVESGGAKIETTDGNGVSALQHACCLTTSLHVVQYLVRKRPSNIDEGDLKLGYNALHKACRIGELNIVRCLIEEGGANVKAVTKSKETALIRACCNTAADNFGLIRYLVETCMVDESAADCMGRTPLHVASILRHRRIILYLMSRYPVNGP